VDQISEVVPEVGDFTRWVIQSKLVEDGIEVQLNHCIDCILSDSLTCTCDGNETRIEGDAFVLALGMTPNTDVLDALADVDVEVIAVGDAVKPRKVLQAIHEGFHAGRRI
jgi:NADH dehydrogenase FAD-containing subunit